MRDYEGKVMADNSYPPAAFGFKVVFSATAGLYDTSFEDVSGISTKMDTEPYTELGQNSYVYELPKAITYTNLILKRGIAEADSPLVVWCQSVFGGDFSSPIEPSHIMVLLLNENSEPIRAWGFDNAYPVSWEVESFNSTKNEVAIEKIELKYNYMNRVK